EEIAVLQLDGGQSTVVSVQYKNNLATTSLKSQQRKYLPEIKAIPNPAKSRVYFDCSGLTDGEYRLLIYDLLGKEWLNRASRLTRANAIHLDLTSFKTGTYLYGREDQLGNRTAFSRMVSAKSIPPPETF